MNHTELIEAIERRYWCMIGPPRAYFEIQHCNESTHNARLVYVELRAKVRGRLADNESFLTAWMDEAIGTPADAGDWNRGACLFWRLALKIEVDEQETTLDGIKTFCGFRPDEIPTTEEIFARSRAIGDNKTSDDLGWWSKIYARLVIPGRDMSAWICHEGETCRELVRP